MKTAMIVPEAMRDVPAPYVTILREAGFEVRYPRNPTFTRGKGGEEEALRELEGIAAIIAGGGESYTRRVISQLPELRVIARSGVGYDRVDVQAASDHGVAVTITPTANHESVAEHALMLILASCKNLIVNDRRARDGTWRRELTAPVRGQTLGIIGLGRIGRSLAVRARALGMRLLVCETFPDNRFVQEHGIQLVDLDQLLSDADVVSVHCPLNEQTRGMFNQQLFARMKAGARFVNTARGGLVVERDLLAALDSGHLAGAALDVFEVEPASADNPLFQHPRVVVTPHIASADTLALEDMGIEAARCIAALSRNQWPEGAVVNNELRSTWSWKA
jgi:D-3-phosphoglycerate dehydrogenase / 2-oxoglutarate reductase